MRQYIRFIIHDAREHVRKGLKCVILCKLFLGHYLIRFTLPSNTRYFFVGFWSPKSLLINSTKLID